MALLSPWHRPALADTAPDRGLIAFKYFDYRDWQPGAERIGVTAPAMSVSMPLGEDWSFAGSHVVDTVSGASPRYHAEPSSLTRMRDVRRGVDAQVTRYFARGSLTAGVSSSRESDYESKNVSLRGGVSDESKNTTFNAGVSFSRDRINPSNQVVTDERKSIADVMVGVTRILTRGDIAQLSLTHGSGRGYYSDPYKFFDNRPRRKTTNILALRWNHHFDATDGTARLGYRYYRDSFGIRSHTVTGEYVRDLGDGWTVTPLVRFYSQNAADFYVGPSNPPDPTIPDDFVPGETYLSEDQRLSAFGARSFGAKVSKWVTPDFQVDLKCEFYRQRSGWTLNGTASPGIAPFSARILQLGLNHYF